jgi:hypothetical protein
VNLILQYERVKRVGRGVTRGEQKRNCKQRLFLQVGSEYELEVKGAVECSDLWIPSETSMYLLLMIKATKMPSTRWGHCLHSEGREVAADERGHRLEGAPT